MQCGHSIAHLHTRCPLSQKPLLTCEASFSLMVGRIFVGVEVVGYTGSTQGMELLCWT